MLTTKDFRSQNRSGTAALSSVSLHSDSKFDPRVVFADFCTVQTAL